MNTFAFSTSQYDAMLEFFTSLGFSADTSSAQLCPLFEKHRGCILALGDTEFNLEESLSPRKADFNLLIEAPPELDLSDAVSRYRAESDESVYGSFLSFTSPDGGRITIQK